MRKAARVTGRLEYVERYRFFIACFISSRAKPDLLGALDRSSYSSGSWLRLTFTLTWITFSDSQTNFALLSAIDFCPLSWYTDEEYLGSWFLPRARRALTSR